MVASSYDAARVSGEEGVTVILLSVSVTTVGSVNGEAVFVAETPLLCVCVNTLRSATTLFSAVRG